MARPGPRPTPTNVVLLHGNPGKRRRPPEPKAPPLVDLKPPAGMSATARAMWQRLAPECSKIGTLTVVDVPAFVDLCECFAIREAARKAVVKNSAYVVLTRDRAHGGEPRRHPALLIFKQFDEAFRAWCKEFGLTPSARVGLPVAADDGDEDDDL